jgi:methyl-accepting chemotaxis protein WspA
MDMWRLSDISIKSRMYALLALSTIGVSAVLCLAVYLMHTFRINGPIYEDIARIKTIEAVVRPSILCITEPYITLHEMETSQDKDEVRALKRRFEKEVKLYYDTVARLRELPDSDFRRKLEIEAYDPAGKIIDVANSEFLPLIGKDEASHAKATNVLRDKIMPLYKSHRRLVDDAVRMIENETRQREEAAMSSIRFWMRGMILLSVVTVSLGGVVGWITSRSIVRTTGLLNGRVKEMASGASDLTARVQVDTHDEMGQLAQGINAMIAKIQAVVAKVRESSIQLLSTASQIAATAREQDATVQGLSSSTAEVAAAVREITATSKELSGTMSEVNERASQAADLAGAGRTRLLSMESTMQQLVDSTALISSKLATIREKADSINLVVTTITKVADQTNLLSINAAIEAEKAGEYGRGFLVVAREIRRLADQTAVATLDIENLVRHMQDAVSTGVMQMDKFTDEVRSGVSKVAEVNSQTGQIIEEVHALTDRFHQVNEGMRNQAIGAEQINDAMASMTGNIRQTAAALEEFNRATAHLRSSVESLNLEIAQFKI